MSSGQPEKMPCGVVDNDNSAVTRTLIRRLDAFQSTKVVAHYTNVNEARRAIQQGKIYAYLYIPEGTTAKLQMLGKTNREIKTTLQPIALDVHTIGNPWLSYNIYLSTIMVPGVFMLFMLLITVYSIGTELKFGRSKEWMQMAGKNIFIALSGKLLPQFLVFFSMFLCYEWYVYGHLNFPHPGGISKMLLIALLTVTAAQGFGVFVFGLMPSLRMSMSVCSLWAVEGFSACGAAFPLFAIDSPIIALAQLIPLRHYYMVYQIAVFNGYPLINAWPHVVALVAFAALPLLTARNIRRAMLEYVYIP